MRQFEDTHPMILFLFFCSVIIPVMFVVENSIIVIGLISGIVYLWILNKQISWKHPFLSVAIALFFAVFQGIFVHRGDTIIMFINNRGITMESIEYGWVTGMMLSATFIWFLCFSKVIISESVMYLLRKVPKTALLITITLKMIPSYMRKYKDVSNMNKVNNIQDKNEKKNVLKQISTVFTWALENSMQTADSMIMRGFKTHKIQGKLYRMQTRDIIILIVIILMQLLYFTHGIVRILLCVFMFSIPMIFRIKEHLKWMLYKLKI